MPEPSLPEPAETAPDVDPVTGVRWLTTAEQAIWRRFAEVLVMLPAALESQLQRDSDLTHVGYVVLSALSEQPGRRLAMSLLARRSSSSLSRLSHVVTRLESRGWVRRERDPDDGRVQIAVLTESGMAKVVRTAPGHVATVRRLVFDRLTAEQAAGLAGVAEALLAGRSTAIESDRML